MPEKPQLCRTFFAGYINVFRVKGLKILGRVGTIFEYFVFRQKWLLKFIKFPGNLKKKS